MSFKIGEKVEVVDNPENIYWRHQIGMTGEVVEIFPEDRFYPGSPIGYRLDFDDPFMCWKAQSLRRLPDEYDGNKACDWALVTCWKPKRVEA